MDSLTFFLTVPGGWLVDLFFAYQFPFESEARADFTVTLGLAFWVVVLVLAWLALRWWRPQIRRAARAGEQVARDGATQVAAQLAPPLKAASNAWSGPQAWGAVWRAQAVHIGLYLGVPLAWELARGVLLIVLLPLTILSFADQTGPRTDGTLDHLSNPLCWTFVTFCPGPRSSFLHAPVIDASKCRSAGDCPPGTTRVTDSGGWLWKLTWAGLTWVWLARWRQRRRRSTASMRV